MIRQPWWRRIFVASAVLALVALIVWSGAAAPEPRGGAAPLQVADAADTAVAPAHDGDAAVDRLDPRADEPFDRSPLMRAIRDDRVDAVELLLAEGARVNRQDDQWSALMLAAFLGDQDIVRALLARGADVNAANARGMTSLMHAAGRGNGGIARALLANGAAVNTVDAAGDSALMFAANNGHPDIVTDLLARGAHAGGRNRAGSTAAALAAGNGYGDIVRLLATGSAPQGHAPRAGDSEIGAPLSVPDERQMYAAAAAAAWRYVERYSHRSTGLIDATSGYAYATIWDIGSGLSALYAAHELSLIDTGEYDLRVRRMLRTLAGLELFDGAAFNKVYSTRTGLMAGSDGHPSMHGYGWSAIDIGRLLVWLRILAINQPQYRDDAAAVVSRLAMDRIVKDGYLYGATLDAAGAPYQYQEGRIGYEQYAARGFAAWGFPPQRALRLRENGVPVTVMGQQLLADLRGSDRITSDPLVLMGLELGWDRDTRQLAAAFLAAQRTRYQKTGQVTLVGEDAMSEPPHFFYYYSALTNGKDFALDVQDPRAAIEKPRWVSAKAALAWHALLPSAYTALALRSVAPARTADGWASGVYEMSGLSTGTQNLNTAGVILAAALVYARGEPLLRPTGPEEP